MADEDRFDRENRIAIPGRVIQFTGSANKPSLDLDPLANENVGKPRPDDENVNGNFDYGVPEQGLFLSNADYSEDVTTDAFIITVQTDAAGGVSDSNEFLLPLFTGEIYDFSWETSDGQSGTWDSDSDLLFTFDSAGTYDIEITGIFPRIYFNNGGDGDKLIDIKQWGIIEWSSMQLAFTGCSILQVSATDISNFIQITNMIGMFRSCTGLTSIDVTGFDTSNVINMNAMFRSCSSLDPDISVLNVTSLQNANGMMNVSEFGTTNYDLLLNVNSGWASQVLQNGVPFHAGSAQYSEGAVTSGTTDGNNPYKLEDLSQTFIGTVNVGDIVHNTMNDTYAKVTDVDSNQLLTLDNDIMANGQTYVIQGSDAAKGRYVMINTYSWTITDGGTI